MDRSLPGIVVRNIWCVGGAPVFRAALQASISGRPGCRCQRILDTHADALAGLKEGDPPELMFVELSAAFPEGSSFLALARQMVPQLRIVVIAGTDDPALIFDALVAGADGTIESNPKPQRVTLVLDEVLNGGASVSPAMVRYVLDRIRHPSVAAKPRYGLSNREREILYHLVNGRTMKEVAAVLGISYHTVDRHMRGLYGKLGEHTRGGVVAKATREGLLS